MWEWSVFQCLHSFIAFDNDNLTSHTTPCGASWIHHWERSRHHAIRHAGAVCALLCANTRYIHKWETFVFTGWCGIGITLQLQLGITKLTVTFCYTHAFAPAVEDLVMNAAKQYISCRHRRKIGKWNNSSYTTNNWMCDECYACCSVDRMRPKAMTKLNATRRRW